MGKVHKPVHKLSGWIASFRDVFEHCLHRLQPRRAPGRSKAEGSLPVCLARSMNDSRMRPPRKSRELRIYSRSRRNSLGETLTELTIRRPAARISERSGQAKRKWLDPASGKPITAHGFRATFRTLAEEVATFPHAVVEQAMGHQVGNQVERAYRRTDLLEHRRDLMSALAALCSPRRADAIQLRKREPA
jgi:integrase